jgi:hypothetical protein
MLLRGRPAAQKERVEFPAFSGEKTPKPIVNQPEVDIVGTIVLSAPKAIGEKQSAKVTIKTKAPSTISGYVKDGTRYIMRAATDKALEHELTFEFTADAEGFVKVVKVDLDSGKTVEIPVGVQ